MQFEQVDVEMIIGFSVGYAVGMIGAVGILGIPYSGKELLGLNVIASFGAFSGAFIGFLDVVLYRSVKPQVAFLYKEWGYAKAV